MTGFPNLKRVAVLYGGDSPERDVSLSSGASVCKGLEEAGFDVEPIERTSAGEFIKGVTNSAADVFFVALHGGWGEDGRLQSVLELMGRAYTGSGPGGCALAMDKAASKAVFTKSGVPTPQVMTLTMDSDFSAKVVSMRLEKLVQKWGKAVVKPCSCGSTVGITIVDSPETLTGAIDEASRLDSTILVEQYIPGKEITVTVWQEGSSIRCLPAIEIVPKKGFYTYEAKYTPGRTEYLCPAPLEETVAKRVQKVSAQAHRCLGCGVYSRVDLRLTDKGAPYVLEVNTAPGMTATSLVPKSARAEGWEFPELLRRISENSLVADRK